MWNRSKSYKRMKAEKIIDALTKANFVESDGTFSMEKGENVKEVLTGTFGEGDIIFGALRLAAIVCMDGEHSFLYNYDEKIEDNPDDDEFTAIYRVEDGDALVFIYEIEK